VAKRYEDQMIINIRNRMLNSHPRCELILLAKKNDLIVSTASPANRCLMIQEAEEVSKKIPAAPPLAR